MKVLTFSLLFSISSLLLITGCLKKVEPRHDAALEKAKKEATAAAGDFMKSLKEILVREMKEKGPEGAFDVCSDTAQKFTAFYSKEKGMEIHRVAYMNRNPLNLPDQAETMWMKEIENMMKEKSFNRDTVLYRVVKSGRSRMLHLVKPIFLAPECVVCHGTEDQIPEAVMKKINEKYPEDKARNFQPGELRGLVTVRLKI
ncbi:MAG: DUF3365 domain-containing protein [Ignavibacteriales bacterium]|nr:MAG: DUF3365 domain-containing protein [Ignavibacteriaceae bacterium]MBW7874022.1 DUF3365 domain-containing protein [Ignavibacteria bacterium]MCZ2143122.1 DUF3365 domain-containing protein [Ignavibacteriales bacterium]OQY73572.1 MAG: hypothetical protein B6D45_07990 [Ignavibacteriales bacterium UTCHB3]MBV6444002.1 hypothetical protein [Ignavibacteriaceae bacterium]